MQHGSGSERNTSRPRETTPTPAAFGIGAFCATGFGGVEQFAPWVRTIHFVTWGHLPAWLNVNHPKLHIVNHRDYIPEQYLPTFNSNVLEIYMHRIEGLAEHFVYFNDDFFLIRPYAPKMFFRKGKPCGMLAFQPIIANPKNPIMSHLYLNNILVLCKYFKKRENVRQQWEKYFHPGYPPLYFFYNLLEMTFPQYTGLYTVHGPSPYCKGTFLEVWEKESAHLSEMSKHRFRNEQDLTPYLFSEWQKLSGNFAPRNLLSDFAYFEIEENNGKLLQTIRRQTKSVVCLNDTLGNGEFEGIRTQLQAAFGQILPDPSAFER